MFSTLKTIIFVAAALLVFNWLFLSSGLFDEFKQQTKEVAGPAPVSADVVDVFKFTLEDEVIKKQGQPIEGFEPAMFLSVFPGLVATDFDGVEASIGRYVIEEGKLEHELDDTALIHSAAGAITRDGIATLLENVAARADIDLGANGTITDIISVITAN